MAVKLHHRVNVPAVSVKARLHPWPKLQAPLRKESGPLVARIPSQKLLVKLGTIKLHMTIHKAKFGALHDWSWGNWAQRDWRDLFHGRGFFQLSRFYGL